MLKKRKEFYEKKLLKAKESWNPNALSDATKDPFKTLFVARIAYDVTERLLKREFERFGPIALVVFIL